MHVHGTSRVPQCPRAPDPVVLSGFWELLQASFDTTQVMITVLWRSAQQLNHSDDKYQSLSWVRHVVLLPVKYHMIHVTRQSLTR